MTICTHPALVAAPADGFCACGQRLWAPQSIAAGYCDHCRLHHPSTTSEPSEEH